MRCETIRYDKSLLLAELRKAGAEIKGNAIRCPWHDDQHPSAGIYQNEAGVWRFKCQSCGIQGDVFDIRALITGLPLAQILVEGTQAARKTSKKEKASQVNEAVNATEGEKIYGTIEDLRLAASRKGEIQGEYLYREPLTDDIELIVFRLKLGANKKAFLQATPYGGGFVFKGAHKPWPLFNRKELATTGNVVVVEGEGCVASLGKFGIVATTSPGGALNAGQANWQSLAGKVITLWPDTDAQGTAYMQDVLSILQHLDPPASIFWLNPSDLDLAGKEDCVDFIAQLETAGIEDLPEAISQALRKAKPRNISIGVGELLEDTISGRRKNIYWPGPKLSKLATALLPHTITLLCGSPGSAKSFFLLEALAFWHKQGIKIACYQLEGTLDYHLHRVLAQRQENSGLLDLDWIRDNPDLVRQAYRRHEDFLDSIGRYFYECPAEQVSLPVLTKWIAARADEGCRVITVDPVTAVEPTDKCWISDSQFMHKCKIITRKHDLSLVLVVHPRKGSKGSYTLDDLAGGAAYQRDSDTILWLQRHKPKSVIIYGPVGRFQTEINQSLHLCKTRHAAGDGLSIGYIFEGKTLRFAEQGVIAEED